MSGALIEARGVAKSYGARRVLHGVDLRVAPGEAVAIVGENGSGKTTLLKLLSGLLHPDAGEIVRSGRLGYCPQDPLVFERLSVRENFAYFAAAHGLPRWTQAMDELLRRFRFSAHADALVCDVSGGTRQKLNLVLALLHDPDVLLLDEPYSALDWEAYLQFWNHARELRERGKALLVASHLVHDRERYDRVLDLRGGRLLCG